MNSLTKHFFTKRFLDSYMSEEYIVVHSFQLQQKYFKMSTYISCSRGQVRKLYLRYRH